MLLYVLEFEVRVAASVEKPQLLLGPVMDDGVFAGRQCDEFVPN
jgi:hypothetical protein